MSIIITANTPYRLQPRSVR